MSRPPVPHAGPSRRFLIIDDDAFVASTLVEFLHAEGHDASSVGDGSAGLDALAQRAREGEEFDVVLCDVSLPGLGGIDVLRRVRVEHPGLAVVMLTGYGSVETAVESLRLGATDYLVKPVVDAELRVALARAIQQRELLAENGALRRRLDSRHAVASVVGGDERMARILELVEAVAPSKTTVLMSGESGTGKSLIAHAIHKRSPRRDKPFVEISCGSIPETLLESELFGHAKGAFTGAHADKVGRFLAADGGTLFLDEINSATPAMQLKLLRVLQERRFEPVGSTRTVEVDVRVVLASNQPLEQLVAAGTFRQDLYYRINVVKIELPPLRERPADIQALADHFLAKHSADLGRQIVGFTGEALDALTRYAFPGNVRELANVVERAAVLCRGQTIQLADLPAVVRGEADDPLLARLRPARGEEPGDDEGGWIPTTLEEALREPERRIIRMALRANAWNRQRTADQLGINRTTLYKKMKALGMDAQPGEGDAPAGPRLAG